MVSQTAPSRPVARAVRWAIAAATWSAVAITLVLLSMGHLWPDSVESLFAPLAWLGFAAFLAIAMQTPLGCGLAALGVLSGVLRCSRASAVALTLGVLVLMPTLRRIFTPISPIGNEPVFSVLSMNIEFSNADVEPALAAIALVNPDVVCIQEYNAIHEERLRPRLTQSHPHVFSVLRANNRGQAIFSKLPLSDARERPFAAGLWQAPPLTAIVHLPMGDVRVVAVHLPAPQGPDFVAENMRDCRELASMFMNYGRREWIVIAGDFNAPANSEQVAELGRIGLEDAHRSRGSVRNRTWPAAGAAYTILGTHIDHILASRELKPMSAAVLGDVGSDHRPVIATFTTPFAASPSAR
ncbi:MAG: endonuclease/exonuclease/phosphatase family protein [Phycisphaerales bacterium]